MDIPEAESLLSQKETKVKKKKAKNDLSKTEYTNTGKCEKVLELQELFSDAKKEIRTRGRGTGRSTRGRGRGKGVIAPKSGSRAKIIRKNDSDSSISAESSSDDLQEEQYGDGCSFSGELRRVWCLFL